MQRLLAVFILFSSLTSSFAAIYGDDNRQDISELSKLWQINAKAVAVALPSFYLQELNKDSFQHEEWQTRNFQQETGICLDEKFAKQKTFGHCTAFLIHPKVLLTAGHCFLPAGKVVDSPHSYCEEFSFWLGYNNAVNPVSLLGAVVSKKDVVNCRKVIYAENNQTDDPNENPVDFALLELEEEVDHISSLVTSSRSVSTDSQVATIGHPMGLPAKFSGFSRVIESHNTSFTSFMDTQSGNSGGPVFNNDGEVVGLLVAGHPTDTYLDKTNKCERFNTCDEKGENCKSNDAYTTNLLIKPEVWQPYLNKFLRDSNLL